MARRPFFSGNYGSALGSTANAANLIARAGQQQGQMYANMGAQIGGMIQQYGLNKEKRRKEEDTAMGTLAGMSPQELLQIGQENPKLGKAIERATSDQATPRDFQLINASAAPIMAGQLRRVKMEGLQNANKMAELNFGIAKELKDTRINIAKNQGVMSDLATKLAQETDPKKRELLGVELQNQIDSITRLGPQRIKAEEGEIATKTVTDQLKQETAKSAMRLLPKQEQASDVSLDTSIKTDQAKLQTLPSTTDATIAGNLLSKASAVENLGLLPQRTQLTEEQIKTDLLENQVRQDSIPEQAKLDAQKRQLESRKLDVENEFMDIVGIKNYAKMKADDLKTMSDINKAKLKQTSAAAEYYTQKGMADLITAANKASPSFKDSYAPILEMQGKLLTTKVVVPGSKERITLEDYLKEHENDKDKYPLNGLPGHLHSLLLQFEKSGQDLIKSQTVQVNVPDANQAQGSQVANQSDLLQAMENIPSVRANREANIRRSAELGKERREIFDDPNSNIYLY